MNSTTKPGKFSRFLKNNAALLLIIFCVVAIVSVVLAVSLTRNRTTAPDDVVVVNPDPDDSQQTPQPTPTTEKVNVYFVSPVNYTQVSMEYTDGSEVMFVFNSTLNMWKSHNAVDLAAVDGSEVVAMYDGTVIDVSETYGLGNVVKIDHGDNVVATYASLADVQVVKGQTVHKGETIGVAGTTASYEFADGAHLHLEVTKDGISVDPMPYVEGKVFRQVEREVKN